MALNFASDDVRLAFGGTFRGKSLAKGGGGRFARLKALLSKKKGIFSPGGLASKIGRNKYGKAGFSKLSAIGRRRAARTSA